jgi:hypothetical protein
MKWKNLFMVVIVLCIAGFMFTACYDTIVSIYGAKVVEAMTKNYITSRDILDDGKIHVILAGTGSPRADGNRSHPCTAVVANGQFLVFDAGAASVDKLSLQGYPIQDTEHTKKA